MLTPGSWWQEVHTGERMVVARSAPSRQAPPGRVACFVEGFGLLAAWLTEREVRATWRLWRPKAVKTPAPSWLMRSLKGEGFRDVWVKTAQGEIWLSVDSVKWGWVCLCGMTQDTLVQIHDRPAHRRLALSHGNQAAHHAVPPKQEILCPRPFEWSCQLHSVAFLPMDDAIIMLRPRYDKRNAWDKIMD